MQTVAQRMTGLLHAGGLPSAIRASLEAEGWIVYLANGVATTTILRDFRAPGLVCTHRWIRSIGFLALSDHRLVVGAGYCRVFQVDVPFASAGFRRMAFRATPKYLSIAFDAADHIPNASGQVEVRLRLPDVSVAAKCLEEAGASFTGIGTEA